MEYKFYLYRVENGVRFRVCGYDTQEEADVDRVACLEACQEQVDRGELDFIVVEGEDA